MPHISVSGSIDPLLSVVLDKGDEPKAAFFPRCLERYSTTKAFFSKKLKPSTDQVRFFSLRRFRATLPCYRRGSAST